MILVQCSNLQLVLLAIFVIFLIVLMEQITEYFYFRNEKWIKVRFDVVRQPRYFNGEKLPYFCDDIEYFVKYKKFWWQKYKYITDCWGRPMKFASVDAAKECLKKEGYKLCN